MPALCPERAGLSVFPSASPLSSTDSAPARAALFAGFAGTTGLSDCPPISGLRPWPSPSGPLMIGERASGGPSRFSRMELPYMPWFSDRAGFPGGSRLAPPTMLPSALHDDVGTPDVADFAAQ